MKSATELMKIYAVRKDWKSLKLWAWADKYGAKAAEWNEIIPPVEDDRSIFVATYKQVYDAINSLPDNPHSWVAVAVQHEMAQDSKLMDGILARFSK